MTRADLRTLFRLENPEMPANVISDAALNTYLLQGDKDFCARTRCIIDQAGFTYTPNPGDIFFDLTTIPNFADIDEYPGGGVAYNNKRLTKTTIAELDKNFSMWRTRDSGTPKQYFRRGQFLYFDRPILASAGTVTTNGTVNLVGVNTSFTTIFSVGDTIFVSGETARVIAAIVDNTHLSVTVAFTSSVAGLTYSLSTPTPYTTTICCILLSTDITLDTQEPFNGLTYLRPYHVGLVYYLTWRAKVKIAKPEESAANLKIYTDYAAWVRKELANSKYGPITLRRGDMVDVST